MVHYSCLFLHYSYINDENKYMSFFQHQETHLKWTEYKVQTKIIYLFFFLT